MTKWLKFWPHALSALLLVALISVVSRDDEPKPIPLSSFTQQDIDKSVQIAVGMKAEGLQKLMGTPIKKELSGDREEWHYCRTGQHIDEYIAVRLQAAVVTEVEHYTVSPLDLLFHHTATPSKDLIKVTGLGDCKLTVRWGTYGLKTPQRLLQQQSVPADRPRPSVEHQR